MEALKNIIGMLRSFHAGPKRKHRGGTRLCKPGMRSGWVLKSLSIGADPPRKRMKPMKKPGWLIDMHKRRAAREFLNSAVA